MGSRNNMPEEEAQNQTHDIHPLLPMIAIGFIAGFTSAIMQTPWPGIPFATGLSIGFFGIPMAIAMVPNLLFWLFKRRFLSNAAFYGIAFPLMLLMIFSSVISS